MCLSPKLLTRVCFWQDTGISVRKRVIKILRDICLEQPGFHKITEMCVKMIRRVNDEEGIKVCLFFFFLSSDIGFGFKELNLKCKAKLLSPAETGERDIPEAVVHPDTQSRPRCHEQKDP